MAVVNWDNNLPSGASAIQQGDDDLRSLTTSLQQALASEHTWVTGPGVEERGRHLPSSSRVSFGAAAPRHNQLDSGQTGLLFLETGGGSARLLMAYPSTASTPVGGGRVVFNRTTPSISQIWVDSAFTAITGSAASLGVTYISDTEPIIVATSEADVFVRVGSFDSVNVTINGTTAAGVNSDGDIVHIRVIGQVTLSEL